MGLIWEISAHAAHQNAWNFGARLFCKNIKKSGFNDIYNIQFFQDTYSQNGFFRKCFSHPTRPPVRPARPSWITSYQTGSCSSISQFRTESKWCVFQYFSVQNWVKMVRVPIFPGSQVLRMVRFPIFPGSQAIKMDRFPIFPGSQASNPAQNQLK